MIGSSSEKRVLAPSAIPPARFTVPLAGEPVIFGEEAERGRRVARGVGVTRHQVKARHGIARRCVTSPSKPKMSTSARDVEAPAGECVTRVVDDTDQGIFITFM